jgi:AcrR family transcriptional regulator
MGIVERREREKQEVRTKILDAARALFAKEGYEAVTMRRVAEAIEYSPTAIYLHFPDKEALIRELCEDDFLTLAKAFQRIAKEPDPLERLRKIGMAYVEFGLTNPNHYRLMFMTSRVHEEGRMLEKGNPEEDAYAFLVATVADALEKGLLKPELKDPHLVAQAAWAGVHGVISLHLAKQDDPWVDWRPARKTAALVVDATIEGLARKR